LASSNKIAQVAKKKMKAQNIIHEWRACTARSASAPVDGRSIDDSECSLLDLSSSSLSNPAFRATIYAALHPRPTGEDRHLLRHLLELEMDYRRREENDDDYFENLYWCGLLLYQLGVVEDVILLWRAKHVNMDTGIGFDIQFLVGAGVDETLAFLKSTSTLPTSSAGDDDVDDRGDAKKAHDYIVACRDGGDFDDLDRWLANRVAYHDPSS
jgi:hypothetical protein